MFTLNHSRNHLRLLAVGLAFSFAFLTGGRALADDLSGTYSGGYENSQGFKKPGGSKITIRQDGNGGFSGDWDGYIIEGGRQDGKTLTWWHDDKMAGKAWVVKATIEGGNLTVHYDVYRGELVLLGVPNGDAQRDYFGDGTFKK